MAGHTRTGLTNYTETQFPQVWRYSNSGTISSCPGAPNISSRTFAHGTVFYSCLTCTERCTGLKAENWIKANCISMRIGSENRRWSWSLTCLSNQEVVVWYNWRLAISNCSYLSVYLTHGKSSPGHLIRTSMYQKRSARARDDDQQKFSTAKLDTQQAFLSLWNSVTC